MSDTGTKLSDLARARRPQGTPLSWAGRFVPQIGQRVHVTSPDRGHGRVTSFFAAGGQLGVQVTLENPSGPWTPELAARKRVIAFGHEIEPEADQ